MPLSSFYCYFTVVKLTIQMGWTGIGPKSLPHSTLVLRHIHPCLLTKFRWRWSRIRPSSIVVAKAPVGWISLNDRRRKNTSRTKATAHTWWIAILRRSGCVRKRRSLPKSFQPHPSPGSKGDNPLAKKGRLKFMLTLRSRFMWHGSMGQAGSRQ